MRRKTFLLLLVVLGLVCSPHSLFAASPYVNLQAPDNLAAPSGAITSRTLVAGDFNEDGMPDIVAA